MSDFRFACPHCGQRISGDAAYRGKEIVCPACQKTLTVPAPVARAPIPHEAPAPAGDQKKISTLALLSLVCSCALGAGSIPGIVLGHLAKARIKANPALRGGRLATAGLVAGYSFLLLTMAFLTVGFVALTPEHGRRLTAQEDAANTPAVLSQRLVDEVKIGDRASESEHGMRARTSRGFGEFMGRKVRDAINGGFFSYTLKVDPAQPMTLRCTYWGNDGGGRRFDILADEKVIATERLEFNDPGRFFNVDYEVPQAITRGKTNVTVVFQAYPGKLAGGVYACQMLRR